MRRLLALALAGVLAAGGIGWTVAVAEGSPRGTYVAYPTAEQVANYNFMLEEYRARKSVGNNPLLVFGSSELNPKIAGDSHPARLFRAHDYGVDPMMVGRALCPSLWQAIEMGAFAHDTDEAKMVVFASMQWFMCYQNTARNFSSVFSSGAYESFMANDELTPELREWVRRRVREYGVPMPDGKDPVASLPLGLDRALGSVVSDVRLEEGRAASGVGQAPVTSALGRTGADGEPDWPAIMAASDQDARGRSSHNEYGFYDTYREKGFPGFLRGAQRSWRVDDGAYFSEREYEDFEALLQVCRQAGVEVLVVIQPVKGAAYDQTIYDREVRETYYARMRAMCERAGAQVADFSDREYDTYFLRDISHPSAVGSAYYSRAIFGFYTDGEVRCEPVSASS